MLTPKFLEAYISLYAKIKAFLVPCYFLAAFFKLVRKKIPEQRPRTNFLIIFNNKLSRSFPTELV